MAMTPGRAMPVETETALDGSTVQSLGTSKRRWAFIARVAVTPMDGALRFGGTMELAGTDESIACRRVRGIVRAATRYFPAFSATDFAGIEPWRGLRPVSPDGMPYLGRTRRWKNLLVATGHAMMGLSLAPATGKIVADLLAEKDPGVDLRLLDPERFG